MQEIKLGTPCPNCFKNVHGAEYIAEENLFLCPYCKETFGDYNMMNPLPDEISVKLESLSEVFLMQDILRTAAISFPHSIAMKRWRGTLELEISKRGLRKF